MPTAGRSSSQSSTADLAAQHDKALYALEKAEDALDPEGRAAGSFLERTEHLRSKATDLLRSEANNLFRQSYHRWTRTADHENTKAAHSIVAEYRSLLSTTQGQEYAEADAKLVDIEAKMDQQTYQSLEPSKDSVRPQERSGKYNAKFWVDLGEACAELLSFGQKHEEYGAIYDRLLQLRTESLSGGRTRVKYVGHGYYLSMLQGDDMLKRYKVAQDAATLAMQVSAISFPGHILVGHCRVIQQIVAAQPCETIDGRSRPLYRHIGELVWKPECNAIPHAEAVRAVAMHFGTLLGFATAYNPHLTLQPNVRSPFVPEKRIPGSHSS